MSRMRFWQWALAVLAALAVVLGLPALASWTILRVGWLSSEEIRTAVALFPSFVSALAAAIMALFTLALWRATDMQARATREMKLLQERLQRVETAPIFFLEGVKFWYSQDPSSGILLHKLLIGAFSNLGKYGLAVRHIEWWFFQGGVLPELWGEYTAFALAPGERREGIAIDLSPKHVAILAHMAGKREGQGVGESKSVHLGFLVVEFRYGGDPSREERACYEMVPLNLTFGRLSETGSQRSQVWVEGSVRLVKAGCPPFLVGGEGGEK